MTQHFSAPNPNRPSFAHVDGVLLVDKPGDHTSHDVVARVRGKFRMAKVGHGGTLDPSATGLLILLVGKGTRISDRIMGHDKTYEGIIRLGATTNTQDAEGEILTRAEPDAIAAITEEQVRAAFQVCIGDQQQIPPMVSAIKIKGVPLYKMARKGREVEREARPIHIYRMELLSVALPDLHFRVACSKGTYVRTLAHDIGAALGVGGHLAALRRTKIGPFDIADAIALDDLLAAPTPEPFILSLPRTLAALSTP